MRYDIISSILGYFQPLPSTITCAQCGNMHRERGHPCTANLSEEKKEEEKREGKEGRFAFFLWTS